MNTEMTLTVTEIQRFCMHDGHGLRTTVFLKGCPLHCPWCHNPETGESAPQLLFYSGKCIGCGACFTCPRGVHSFPQEGEHRVDRTLCLSCGACAEVCPTGALTISGKALSAEDILRQAERDRAFYGAEGGITVSGGEPFAQPEGLIALLTACRERGIPAAVETSGYGETADFVRAVPCVDLFLWDVKDTDPARHRRYTGVDREGIESNLRAVDREGGRTRLRGILVNGVNTEESHYEAVASLARSLRHCEGVEWSPYHAYGGSKAALLGKPDNGKTEWIPTAEQCRRARAVTEGLGVRVF